MHRRTARTPSTCCTAREELPLPDLLLHLSRRGEEFVTFAEYVGPQLIKQGSVSELMKQIRQTEVVKAAVEYQGRGAEQWR